MAKWQSFWGGLDNVEYGIYFDAKCGLGDDCRISVRDIITDNEIPFKDSINKYIAMVEPHRAVVEPDYFMKLIEMCEFTKDQEIEMRESGKLEEPYLFQKADMNVDPTKSVDGSSQAPEQNEPINDWEKLQMLPHDQYLIHTIMPILYQGLKVVATTRPRWPIKVLALYMLKNQDKISLPNK